MKVFEALAQAFRDEETEVVFSLMGDGNMFWLSHMLATSKIRNVHVRHESATVAAADGYARASGRVAVATVTSGPGLTGTVTALTAAARVGVPMVLFAGDTMPGDTTGIQAIDHRAFATLCGVHCETVLTPATCLDSVQMAFRRARELRQPVLLSVPMELQQEEYPADYNYTPSTKFAGLTSGIRPDDDALDAAAGLIASSQRPVIILGEGLSPVKADLDWLETFGDRIGALYATTLRAKGTFGESPWWVGIAGSFSTPEAEALLRRADLVIGVGASLNSFTRQSGYLFENARTIQINDKPSAAVRHSMPVNVYLQGDARLTVDAIDRILADGDIKNPGWRNGEPPAVPTAEWKEFDDSVDPRAVIDILDRSIPNNALVVCGAGHFWAFINKGFHRHADRRFMYTLGFGSIGQGVSVAIGAAHATDRPVVVLEGDTGVMLHVAELDTAVRSGIDMTVIVLDDDAMGAEVHKLREKGAPTDAAFVRTPDLAGVMNAFGGHGALVRTQAEFESALAARPASGVNLFDVKISGEVVDLSGQR